MPVSSGSQLLDIVERGSQREFTTSKPDVLIDRKITGKPQCVITDETVRTVRILIGTIRFVIIGQGSGQVDFRQKISTKGTKLPIGRFQFIQGNSSVNRLNTRHSNSFIQGYFPFLLCRQCQRQANGSKSKQYTFLFHYTQYFPL